MMLQYIPVKGGWYNNRKKLYPNYVAIAALFPVLTLKRLRVTRSLAHSTWCPGWNPQGLNMVSASASLLNSH